MKIVNWNCNGAFRHKFSFLESYNADIYVIQECEDPCSVASSNKDYHLFAANCLWVGQNRHRGLGIFAKNTISILKLSWDHSFRGRELQWFLPIQIDHKINLIAVWAHHADAEAFPYIGQFWNFLQNNKAQFAGSIICGDFNSNSIWDKWDRWWNHSDCVKELAELQIFSLYHHTLKSIDS